MKLLLVLALLTGVVVAQETKWAPIPKGNETLLWVSMAFALAAWFVLRSGWGRPERHAAEQAAMGTISNSYYLPRRDAILNGFTIAGGILGSMWWGATSWLVLVRGIERRTAAHGLINLQISVAVGVLAGGLIGAAAGLAIGEYWERRHRRQRKTVFT
jgi:hypothetical protein